MYAYDFLLWEANNGESIKGVIDVSSDVIYKDTCYELTLDVYGNDDIKITGPCPLDKRKSENIIGAWARIILDPEVWGVETYTAIMTLEDIQNAWSMGSAYGKSKAHQNSWVKWQSDQLSTDVSKIL